MATPIDLHDVAERELEARSRYPWRLKACASTACLSAGAGATMQAMERAVEANDLALDVQLIPTGCMGLCSRGPLVRLLRRGGDETMYQAVDAAVGIDIVRSHVRDHKPVATSVLDQRIPFFASQERVVLAHGGVINPDRIESFVAHGGYQALEKVAHLDGARGGRRGGARLRPARPRRRRLSRRHQVGAARRGPGDQKYVVCNGDEGDPGAFMDRTVLEGDPHRVLEGMAIAAYAIGASQGYIYVRAEYPLAVERLDRAIRRARRNRLLGRRILDSDFDLDVEVRIGAGAFVCGEETALIASIEGGAACPGLRPAVPRRAGPVGRPDRDQQRRDAGQRRPDRPPRRRVVRRASAPRTARAPRSSPWPARSPTPA